MTFQLFVMSDNTGEGRDDHRSDRETEEDRGYDTDTLEGRIFNFMDASFLNSWK